MDKALKPIRKTKNLAVPETPGVHHRLICLTGDNKGTSYYLEGRRVIMGRSDQVDIQLLDSKASREHAEIVEVGGKYIVTDLKSQNGVYINDLKITQHKLKSGDKIIIGKTVLKYDVLEIGNEVEIYEEEEEDDEEYEEAHASPRKKRSPVIYVVVLLGLAYVLLDEGTPSKKTSSSLPRTSIDRKSSVAVIPELEVDRDLSDLDKESREKLKVLIHEGLREYREHNYLRAVEKFNQAKLVNPNSGRASFYLNKTQQKIDEEIKLNTELSQQHIESLKYEKARNALCLILKLLERDKMDERYLNAKEKIDTLQKRLKWNKREANCL